MKSDYPFRLGAFTCVCISDGDVNYPVPSFFGNVSPQQAQAILHEFDLPSTHIYSPYTLLLVDTGEHRVLVDTGVGLLGKQVKALFHDVDNSGLEAGIAMQSLRSRRD
jgi:hypothetical protein